MALASAVPLDWISIAAFRWRMRSVSIDDSTLFPPLPPPPLPSSPLPPTSSSTINTANSSTGSRLISATYGRKHQTPTIKSISKGFQFSDCCSLSLPLSFWKNIHINSPPSLPNRIKSDWIKSRPFDCSDARGRNSNQIQSNPMESLSNRFDCDSNRIRVWNWIELKYLSSATEWKETGRERKNESKSPGGW